MTSMKIRVRTRLFRIRAMKLLQSSCVLRSISKSQPSNLVRSDKIGLTKTLITAMKSIGSQVPKNAVVVEENKL